MEKRVEAITKVALRLASYRMDKRKKVGITRVNDLRRRRSVDGGNKKRVRHGVRE